jgi:hypothetical protein
MVLDDGPVIREGAADPSRRVEASQVDQTQLEIEESGEISAATTSQSRQFSVPCADSARHALRTHLGRAALAYDAAHALPRPSRAARRSRARRCLWLAEGATPAGPGRLHLRRRRRLRERPMRRVDLPAGVQRGLCGR